MGLRIDSESGLLPSSLADAWRNSTASPQLVAVAVPIAVFAGAGLVTAAAVWRARWQARLPTVHLPTLAPGCEASAFHQRVLARCTTLLEPYRPAPFLTDPHVETIFAAVFRRAPRDVHYKREVVRTEDGGSVALDWESATAKRLPLTAPVIILLPGLTGGSHNSYVMYAVRRAASQGMRAVVFNSRGTVDSPLTSCQYYSASYTGDMRRVVAHVRGRYPSAPLVAAGWSLGANILLRYLGEEGDQARLSAAVSLCNPFDLTLSHRHLQRGFNRFYDWRLAGNLKRIHAKHEALWLGVKGPFKLHQVRRARTIREFDDALTIHSFGWPSVDAYYAGSSSALSVPSVRVPLLCVQARDDPIAPEHAIPYKALSSNPHTLLVTTPGGGHLGWCAGPGGPRHAPWSDLAMFQWIEAVMCELDTGGPLPAAAKRPNPQPLAASPPASAPSSSPSASAPAPSPSASVVDAKGPEKQQHATPSGSPAKRAHQRGTDERDAAAAVHLATPPQEREAPPTHAAASPRVPASVSVAGGIIAAASAPSTPTVQGCAAASHSNSDAAALTALHHVITLHADSSNSTTSTGSRGSGNHGAAEECGGGGAGTHDVGRSTGASGAIGAATAAAAGDVAVAGGASQAEREDAAAPVASSPVMQTAAAAAAPATPVAVGTPPAPLTPTSVAAGPVRGALVGLAEDKQRDGDSDGSGSGAGVETTPSAGAQALIANANAASNTCSEERSALPFTGAVAGSAGPAANMHVGAGWEGVEGLKQPLLAADALRGQHNDCERQGLEERQDHEQHVAVAPSLSNFLSNVMLSWRGPASASASRG